MGENLEGLPESSGRGMCEEKPSRTWETLFSPGHSGPYESHTRESRAREPSQRAYGERRYA